MITAVSTTYAQIENLCNLAKHHKKHCGESDCGVSLTILKTTVMKLFWELKGKSEIEEANQMINSVKWS